MKEPIEIGSDFSGCGALIQALRHNNIKFEENFACDLDKFARKTYCLNYGTSSDVALAKSKEHDKIADDILKCHIRGSEVPPSLAGAAEDMAKQFSFYFPFDVYQRRIPIKPLTIYMTSPPCQAFSLSGKRLGKDDRRGILFFNSLEFISINKPRFFIFENVKGLLSHDKTNKKAKFGNTFQEWVNFLGGKSVNGNQTVFPYDDSVPYHIYHTVLNATDFTVPQNRERVFIIGIRDDADNDFLWPKTTPLKKRLKDVLEPDVDEKYFLSQKMIEGFLKHAERHDGKGNGFGFDIADVDKPAATIMSPQKMHPTDNYVATEEIKGASIRGRNPENPKSRKSGEPTEQMVEVNENPDIANTLTTVEKDNVILIKSNTEKGFDVMTEEDSLNYSVPDSKTRRVRVGKGVAQTLDTSCNQAVMVKQINPSKESGGKQPYQQNRVYDADGIAPALGAGQEVWGGNIVAEKIGSLYEGDGDAGRIYSDEGVSRTLKSEGGGLGSKTGLYLTGYRIRRLTPRECFRLMGFPDSFTWDVSDSQAYKQAGNSIVMNVLAAIMGQLKF